MLMAINPRPWRGGSGLGLRSGGRRSFRFTRNVALGHRLRLRVGGLVVVGAPSPDCYLNLKVDKILGSADKASGNRHSLSRLPRDGDAQQGAVGDDSRGRV